MVRADTLKSTDRHKLSILSALNGRKTTSARKKNAASKSTKNGRSSSTLKGGSRVKSLSSKPTASSANGRRKATSTTSRSKSLTNKSLASKAGTTKKLTLGRSTSTPKGTARKKTETRPTALTSKTLKSRAGVKKAGVTAASKRSYTRKKTISPSLEGIKEFLTPSSTKRTAAKKTSAKKLNGRTRVTVSKKSISYPSLNLANVLKNIKHSKNVVKTDEVISVNVKDANKADIGKIEELMLDKVSGRVVYVVLSSGGFLGVGEKLFAIPWQEFHYNKRQNCFILNIDKEKLKNAIGFNKAYWPDKVDKSWRERLS